MGTEINNQVPQITIQKNIVNFCRILPSQVDKWKSMLSEVEKPVQALVNYSEQLRHVECAHITHIDGFRDLQSRLLYKIYMEIEEEVAVIRDVIERLMTTNQDLKNKLVVLEKSTIDLDWEDNTPLILGTAFQPPLSRILQEGYEFMMFFTNALKLINDSFKSLNVRDEKYMKDFESRFKLDLSNKVVIDFLAIVQYVGNEQAVI